MGFKLTGFTNFDDAVEYVLDHKGCVVIKTKASTSDFEYMVTDGAQYLALLLNRGGHVLYQGILAQGELAGQV